MPRQRKDIDTLKLHGTFRQSRHADRALVPDASGKPERPAHLTEDAAWMWDFITDELTTNGTIRRIDTMELIAACELWQLYRKAVSLALADPIDKENRIGVATYLDAWQTAASKLGLNPADRQKLRSDTKSKKTSVATRTRGA